MTRQYRPMRPSEISYLEKQIPSNLIIKYPWHIIAIILVIVLFVAVYTYTDIASFIILILSLSIFGAGPILLLRWAFGKNASDLKQDLQKGQTEILLGTVDDKGWTPSMSNGNSRTRPYHWISIEGQRLNIYQKDWLILKKGDKVEAAWSPKANVLFYAIKTGQQTS